jgi:hypothetical protein
VKTLRETSTTWAVSGIIAMKRDHGEAIVDVQICSEKDDVPPATAMGR